jgi:proline racemase
MLLARTITTVDSHTEGNPTRVVTGGVAIPPGKTIEARWEWAREHALDLLHFLNNEPRGSGMMCSVLLMPPCSAEADFSILILEPQELVPMCGHCVIGAATTVVATGMVAVTAPSTEVVFETPAGLVNCSVAVEQGSVGPVSLRNVPSFVTHRSADVRIDGYGSVQVDVAFGGDFYAIVDADRLGIAVDPAHTRPMIDFAARLIPAVNEQLAIRHPTRPDIARCYETMLTTGARRAAAYRHAVVSPPGDMDRSPCGTGTSARLALLHALGKAVPDERLDFEGLMWTKFGATVASVTTVGDLPAIVPIVSGRAYITAFNTLVLDRGDPFPTGYRLA